MNIQAMMKQAQNLQKTMMKEKEEIDKTVFEETYSFITIQMTGDKKVKFIKINQEDGFEDVELLQDMIMVALNNTMDKIDKVTSEKMGKYTQGIPGLF